MDIKNHKICLTGGGTAGSVTPLLAIADALLSDGSWRKSDFIWIGTAFGLEKEIVAREGITYFSIASGKYRRYFSWRNFIDPFLVIAGFFQAFMILKRKGRR